MIVRYGIYWVALDPTEEREIRKTRPCVVISPDSMQVGGVAVICPLTTTLHPNWAHRLQIRCKGKPAEIMLDQIRAVSQMRFGKHLATLSAKEAQALRDLLIRLYGTV